MEQYGHWRSQLHDLGECEVKHGIRVNVVNLYRDDAGNAELPKKFRAVRQKRNRKRWAALAVALLVLLALAAAFLFLRRPVPVANGGPQVIRSIAVLPLDNYSGDPAQDYFAEANFAPAYSGLSDTYFWAAFHEGVITAKEGRLFPGARSISDQ